MCQDLGVLHPDYLNVLMSPSQLAEWEAYYTLDPFAESKSDVRMAFLSSLIANLFIQTYGKKGAHLTKSEDFMIDWDYTDEGYPIRQSVEEMKAILLGFAKRQNKMVKQKINKLK